jgi:hypothetical protein
VAISPKLRSAAIASRLIGLPRISATPMRVIG